MRRVDAVWAAIAVGAAMMGTVPAVGGYSNASHGGDFTTVGIVIQVEGSSFVVAAGKSAGESVKVGRGLGHGDKLWVEDGGIVRVSDTSGSNLTIAGPTALEFVRIAKLHSLVRITRGNVKFHSSSGKSMYFESPLVNGMIAGEAAVWMSTETAQVAGLSGDVKVWHPQLVNSKVSVSPAFFTESSTRNKYLQPKKPERADTKLFEEFLARFDEPINVASRSLATENAPLESAEGFERGSRTRADVIEAKNDDSIKWVKSHISGIGSGETLPSHLKQPRRKIAAQESGPVKYDAFGQPVRKKVKFVKPQEE